MIINTKILCTNRLSLDDLPEKVKESANVFHLFRALSLSALANESEEKYFDLISFLMSKVPDPMLLVDYCPLIFSFLATSQGSNDRVFDLIHYWFRDNNRY